MRKFEVFFRDIAEVRSGLRGLGTILAKEVIGDSVNNNRTLTVIQTVRFLNTVGQWKLARQLLAVNSVLESTIKDYRISRTDAVDIGEFVNVYREVVMNEGDLRTAVGVALRGV